MPSFYETMHVDPVIRQYLYDLGTDFMGGELMEDIYIDDIHVLLRQVARDIETYKVTGIMPPAIFKPDNSEAA